MKTCLMGVSLIVTIVSISIACGPEWTYIGYPPYEPWCAVGTFQNPQQFLCGTIYAPGVPGSGGIFRNNGQDTSWQFTGLPDHAIIDMKAFENRPGAIYVATSRGLYDTRDNGNNWDLITTVGSVGQWEQISFAISPFDSNEWALASFDFDMMGVIRISYDGGANWQVLWREGYSWNLTYSQNHPELLYFSMDNAFFSLSTADSVIDTLRIYPVWSICSIVTHPHQPWVYVLTEYSLSRYDEDNWSYIEVSTRDSIGHLTTMVMTPGGRPLVGGDSHMYLVSQDLSRWEPVNDQMPLGHVEYASSQSWVARMQNGIYCKSRDESADIYGRSQPSFRITAYPNPTNGPVNFNIPFPAQVEIYNIVGQQVFCSGIENGNAPITWSPVNLPSGSYYFRISTPSSMKYPLYSGGFRIIK